MPRLPIVVSERLGGRAHLPAVQRHCSVAERRFQMTAPNAPMNFDDLIAGLRAASWIQGDLRRNIAIRMPGH
jgi:hypothetical protein